MVSHRSTKGASKARRDHINHEIRNMRALLPISPEEQERLSYLHSMAAICTYIRKSVLLQGTAAEETAQCPLPYEAFLQALHGFILVTTGQGRLVYLSENVSDYLGLSMIDVLQGDTVYDMIERQDVDMVKSNLDISNNSPSERSFVCCMQTSKAFKQQQGSCCSMLVRGSFLSFPQPCPATSAASSVPELLFVALCTPTVNRLRSCEQPFCHSFSSAHRLDMTFTHLSESVVNCLGYSVAEMIGQSWYSLIHPEDVSSSAEFHRSLLNTDKDSEVEMLLRLLCKDQSWTWLYIRANKELQGISCINYPISETEARFLHSKIGSDASRPPSLAQSCNIPAPQTPHTQTYNNNKCLKRQRTLESQEPRTRARRDSEQDVHYVSCVYSQSEGSPVCGGESLSLFTPPYSPTSSSCSSGSSLPQEELSQDPLMDVHGYRDHLPSSPEASPSYFSYPESGLTCRQTDLYSHTENPGHSFEPESFIALSSHPSITLSPPTYDFQSYAPDARLVPDCSSASDMSEDPVDCTLHQEEFNLLVQPEGGSVTQLHQVPHHVLPVHSSLLTPNQSPTSTETHPYSEREQAEISILAQQISSLARSFDMYQSHGSGQAPHTLPSASDWEPHLAPKCDLVLDDNVFESIMKDLEMDTSKSSTTSSGGLCYEAQETLCFPVNTSQQSGLDDQQFVNVETFSLQVGLYDQNTGLHQLNHYMQQSLH